MRDVAADSDFFRLAGTVRKTGDKCVLEGEIPELRLSCSISFLELASALRIDGVVLDNRKIDRAVSIYFVLPVKARLWFDDPLRPLIVEEKKEFRNTVPDGAGARGYHSLYPMRCVDTAAGFIALAMPLDVPRLSRFAYNADSNELFAGFNFGLTSATRKFPSSASFSLVLYGAESQGGMRAALAQFYKFFPEHFKKRVVHEGVWQAFQDIETIINWEDFHFAFKEGNNNVAWDDLHNILTFVYTEPMTCHLKIKTGLFFDDLKIKSGLKRPDKVKTSV